MIRDLRTLSSFPQILVAVFPEIQQQAALLSPPDGAACLLQEQLHFKAGSHVF
jgi:hypothetical protein